MSIMIELSIRHINTFTASFLKKLQNRLAYTKVQSCSCHLGIHVFMSMRDVLKSSERFSKMHLLHNGWIHLVCGKGVRYWS